MLDAGRFDNAFIRELPGDPESGSRRRDVEGALWSAVATTPVAAPRLIAASAESAALLGLSDDDVASQAFADVFAGNRLLPGMSSWAANYGGHQFGHWAGQLGDGRAISLGEYIHDERRWEIQLKGAGRTPYSRGADGRAVLRSSLREFLCSEAMHHLGIPTTRALSLVATGEGVVRDLLYDGHPRNEPGAIVCRLSPSFTRFGSFELPAARGDVALLRQLVDFTIRRDFPELDEAGATRDAEWFAQVCERSAELVAAWMRVGFVHGVLNTDNCSIVGLTIDYGPYGWIDDVDPDWTPNITDAQGRRYRFGQQPAVMYWNLDRLAQALSPLFADAVPLQDGLQRYAIRFDAARRRDIAAKLGFAGCRTEDVVMMETLLGLLHRAEADMTVFFRSLADVDVQAVEPDSAVLDGAFYDADRHRYHDGELRDWLRDYAARSRDDDFDANQRRATMQATNPRYVLRNYLCQQAIDRAGQGDDTAVVELLDVMRRPFDDQPDRESFAALRPDWAKDKPGCSMLSCSS